MKYREHALKNPGPGSERRATRLAITDKISESPELARKIGLKIANSVKNSDKTLNNREKSNDSPVIH